MDPSYKVLIIEDDEVDALSIKRALGKSGLNVTSKHVTDGDQGLAISSTEHFDCIFLDYLLPGKDGLMMLLELRNAGIDAPIIVMTNIADTQVAVDMMKSGATDYLTKSMIDSEVLGRILRSTVRAYRSEQEKVRIKEALDAKDKLLKLIVGNAPMIIFNYDTKGTIQLSEGKGLEPLGLKPGQLVGTNIFEAYSERKDILQYIAKALEGQNQQYSIELGGIWYKNVLIPSRDEQGELVGVSGVSIDITDRIAYERKLEEVNSRISALIENTRAAIWSVDQNIRIQSFNSPCQEQFREMYGIELESNLDLLSVLPAEIKSLWQPMLEKALSGKRAVNEHHYAYNDLNLDLEVSMNPIQSPDGQVTGISVFMWDVSEYKRVEKLLIQARDEAEKSAQIKQEFLANMSHEIRTPMNAIMGFARLLQQTQLNPEQEDYLKAISNSGDILLTIINDILDLSKIEAGALTFESIEFDLPELFRQLERMFKPNASLKGLVLKTELDPAVPTKIKGDSNRLNQILINLLGNAIKFTSLGTVSLKASLKERSNGVARIEFSVSDTGIGIPEEKLSAIFQAFNQASSETTRKYGGTGLGLTICQRLVELQDGKIWVESQENNGSTFFFHLDFELPVDSPEEVEEKDHLEIIPRPDIHILLVEDNPMNQLLARKVLEGFEFVVTVANNGEEAVEWVKKATFNIVLMDVQMPVMDGYQATKIIRNELKSDIPIIALTAHAIKEEMDKCYAAGMNNYCTKPFIPEELYSKIIELTGGISGNIGSPDPSDRSNEIANLEYVEDIAQGDLSFKAEFITMFMENSQRLCMNMEKGLQAGDLNEVYNAAHSLKPSIQMFKVKGGDSLVGEILELSKAEDPDEVLGSKIAALNDLMKEVRTWLAQFLETA